MYIETSSPRTRGDKAKFVSPLRQPTTGSCMTFWYHMYGSAIGSLNLYSKVSGRENLLWTRSGGKGNVWRMAMQTVRSTSNYQVSYLFHISFLFFPFYVNFLLSLFINHHFYSLLKKQCPKKARSGRRGVSLGHR